MTFDELKAMKESKDTKKPTIHGTITREGDEMVLRFPAKVGISQTRANTNGNPMLTLHFKGPETVTVVDDIGGTRDGQTVYGDPLELTCKSLVINANLA